MKIQSKIYCYTYYYIYIYYKTEFIFHLAWEVNSNILLMTIKRDRKIKQLQDS